MLAFVTARRIPDLYTRLYRFTVTLRLGYLTDAIY